MIFRILPSPDILNCLFHSLKQLECLFAYTLYIVCVCVFFLYQESREMAAQLENSQAQINCLQEDLEVYL